MFHESQPVSYARPHARLRKTTSYCTIVHRHVQINGELFYEDPVFV